MDSGRYVSYAFDTCGSMYPYALDYDATKTAAIKRARSLGSPIGSRSFGWKVVVRDEQAEGTVIFERWIK